MLVAGEVSSNQAAVAMVYDCQSLPAHVSDTLSIIIVWRLCSCTAGLQECMCASRQPQVDATDDVLQHFRRSSVAHSSHIHHSSTRLAPTPFHGACLHTSRTRTYTSHLTMSPDIMPESLISYTCPATS